MPEWTHDVPGGILSFNSYGFRGGMSRGDPELVRAAAGPPKTPSVRPRREMIRERAQTPKTFP